MSKKAVEVAKMNLHKRLYNNGFFFNPRTDPIPTIRTTNEYGRRTMTYSCGGVDTVITSDKMQNELIDIINKYRVEAHTNIPATEINLPINPAIEEDFQSEIDKVNGHMFAIVAITVFMTLVAIQLLLKYYA